MGRVKLCDGLCVQCGSYRIQAVCCCDRGRVNQTSSPDAEHRQALPGCVPLMYGLHQAHVGRWCSSCSHTTHKATAAAMCLCHAAAWCLRDVAYARLHVVDDTPEAVHRHDVDADNLTCSRSCTRFAQGCAWTCTCAMRVTRACILCKEGLREVMRGLRRAVAVVGCVCVCL